MRNRNFVVIAILLVILSLGAGSVMADDPVCAPGEGAHTAWGISIEGSIARAIIKNSSDCPLEAGIASYKMFEEHIPGYFDDLETQELFHYVHVTVPAKGEVEVRVNLPDCKAQVDVFWGQVIYDLSANNRYGSRLLSAAFSGGELCGTPPPPPPPPPADPQWCSPGYWRQPHHLHAWAATGYSPETLFFAALGYYPERSNNGVRRNATTNPTLLYVVQNPQFYGGGPFNAVGDLLSGAHPDVHFTGTRVENSCPLGR
jgi:hypothetical protein